MLPNFQNPLRVRSSQPNSFLLNVPGGMQGSDSFPQGGFPNPGEIPLQTGGSFLQRAQPQQPYNQQQFQPGVPMYNLNYLAHPPARPQWVPTFNPGDFNHITWEGPQPDNPHKLPLSQVPLPPRGTRFPVGPQPQNSLQKLLSALGGIF